MKKHLIIHGDFCSGKSIFIKNLLRYKKDEVYNIVGKRKDFLKSNFLWTLGSFRPQILCIHDVNMAVDLDEFLPYTSEFTVNARGHELFKINPMLIIEYSEELKNIPTDSTFTRRFDVLNTNTGTYKEFTNYLETFNGMSL